MKDETVKTWERIRTIRLDRSEVEKIIAEHFLINEPKTKFEWDDFTGSITLTNVQKYPDRRSPCSRPVVRRDSAHETILDKA
jgi:hypothetical protein